MATVINNNSKKKKKGNNKPEKQSVTQVAENVAVIESIAKETETPAVPEMVVVDAVAVSEPIVVAHTSERNAVAATMSEDAAKNFINDVMGMRDSLIASHNSGAVLPAGIADAFRQVADTLMSIEQEDAAKRGMSLNKEVYNSFSVPKYEFSEMTYISDNKLDDKKEYVKFIMPVRDQKYSQSSDLKFPSHTLERSLIQTISDNRDYISDNEIMYQNGRGILFADSPMSLSGLLLYTTDDPEYWSHSYRVEADYTLEFYIPKNLITVINNSHELTILNITSADGISDEYLDGNNIVNIGGELNGATAHAVSFSDICKIITHPEVVIHALDVYKCDKKYRGATPRFRAPDGNIIIAHAFLEAFTENRIDEFEKHVS